MMLFKTTEHYPYFENQDIPEKECLICYNNISHNLLIKNNYNFNCECYKLIHEPCLQLWYNKNGTCPICRKYVYKNNQINLFKIYKSLTTLIVLIEMCIYIYLLYMLIFILANFTNANLFH